MYTVCVCANGQQQHTRGPARSIRARDNVHAEFLLAVICKWLRRCRRKTSCIVVCCLSTSMSRVAPCHVLPAQTRDGPHVPHEMMANAVGRSRTCAFPSCYGRAVSRGPVHGQAVSQGSSTAIRVKCFCGHGRDPISCSCSPKGKKTRAGPPQRRNATPDDKACTPSLHDRARQQQTQKATELNIKCKKTCRQ